MSEYDEFKKRQEFLQLLTKGLQLQKATTDFEHAALKPPILLNGGAMLATLTYLGARSIPAGSSPCWVVATIGAFSIGLACGALAIYFGYRAQHAFYGMNIARVTNELKGRPRQSGEQHEKDMQKGQAAEVCATFFAAAGLALFVVGVVAGGMFVWTVASRP